MRRVSILPAIGAMLLAFASTFAQDQQTKNYTKADFINVDGASLNDKIDRAVKQFKSSRQGDTLWLAYHFPPREDAYVGMFSGVYYRDSDGIKLERKEDPNQVAVFLLTDATGSQPKLTKVKTFNLAEPYVFENRPVYWLGNVDANQSVAVIESAMRADLLNKDLTRGALRAIAVHNSPRSIPLLKEVVSKETNVELQRSAISNLSRIKTQDGLDALVDLYDNAGSDILKEEIIAGIARNESRKATDKLLAIAKNDPNPKMRQRAIRRLSTSRGPGVWVN
ncbi:MAG: HEAT repeat domain-containing protein [Blastocatellia bacterium]